MRGCKNSSAFQNKALGITFHKFPTETFWKTKWIRLIRRNRYEPEWLPSKFSVLCSAHFDECDLHITKGGLRRIKKDALPKKYRLVRSEWCHDVQRAHASTFNPEPGGHPDSPTDDFDTHSDIMQEIDEDYQFDHAPPETLVITCTPNEEFLDSDLESIFDTPRENKLRKRIKLLQERGKLQSRRVKSLNQHVKRLKKRNLYLRKILYKLRQKHKTASSV